ncbi:MAG: outer-membrane lipoprotein carrier protein LolA [Campylobacterales bacterium]|nr:outer-membrane lipoprotein carrier protein LolA [Campylobacterales bacterium]
MRYTLLLTLFFSLAFSDITKLNSFEAEFIQTITDEKGKELSYSGKLKAKKPQFAFWSYETPIEKRVYIEKGRITIVEPEIEQVIVRNIRSDFDFFSLIQNAKKISQNRYTAEFEGSKVNIEIHNSLISTLHYKDKFDNDVTIHFQKQKENSRLASELFEADYPREYDLITE